MGEQDNLLTGTDDADASGEVDPKVDDPKVDDPKVDDPKVDDPKVDDPKVDDPKDGAPETYTEFDMPEGFTLDTGVLEGLTPLLKDANLSQEKAQGLINVHINAIQEQEKTLQQFIVKRDSDWVGALKEDEALGGDNYDSTILNANRVLTKFDPDKELIGALGEMGLTNFTPLLKTLARIAPHFSEDTWVTGGTTISKEDLPDHLRMNWKEVK